MTEFIRFFFLPQGQPWYQGAVWGNILQGLLFLVPSVILIVWRAEMHHRKAEEHRRKIERHLGI